MRIKFSKLYLLTGIGMMCFSSQSFASNCTSAPDCSSLGYTQTSSDCEGLDVIKCPFDTSKVFCSGEAKKEVSVGSILYGDGTVSDSIVSGKRPVGIVFDEENRLALALTDVQQSGSAGSEKMHWSSNRCDTPNLDNCSDYVDVVNTCGTDGRANTDAILVSTCEGTTYAANAVNTYQTSSCSADFCKQGKWFLPSLKDLNTIYSFKSVINNSLSLVSEASQLKEDFYWSSTEYDDYVEWALRMSDGGRFNSYGNYSSYVRPVLAF